MSVMPTMPTPIIQEEPTGCGIAATANILGKTYSEMKTIANAMGIYAEDQSLWSDTQYVRRMLASEGAYLLHVSISAEENVWPLVPPGAANQDMMESKP